MTRKYKIFQQAFKENWYTQGFNAVPVFLNCSAWSGIVMKQKIGFGYTKYLFHYNNHYGEMNYLHEDIDYIWQEVKSKLSKDIKYLEKLKDKYFKIFNADSKVFRDIDRQSLNDVSDEVLIFYLKKCAQALVSSVGIAHVLDSIGLKIEEEFKNDLSKIVNSSSKNYKNFNEYYSILTTPSSVSFISKEESELKKISKLSGKKKQEELIKHVNNYFWIQNSYAGAKKLTVKDFLQRIRQLSKNKKIKKTNILARKQAIIHKLHLSKKMQDSINIINFSAVWQDDRKEIILKSIAYMGKILDQIVFRSGIKLEHLYYLGFKDIENIKSMFDIKSLERELKIRKEGCLFLLDADGEKEIVITGEEYISLSKKMRDNDILENKDIHGSIANIGTATGRVVVCEGLDSINKVRKGDVLVTSMTRPEFLPALKKVAAIITDEGGVTCHAAIISREFNIPTIIGTKIATKVLKDDMLVSVKANHGYVKIL